MQRIEMLKIDREESVERAEAQKKMYESIISAYESTEKKKWKHNQTQLLISDDQNTPNLIPIRKELTNRTNENTPQKINLHEIAEETDEVLKTPVKEKLRKSTNDGLCNSYGKKINKIQESQKIMLLIKQMNKEHLTEKENLKSEIDKLSKKLQKLWSTNRVDNYTNKLRIGFEMQSKIKDITKKITEEKDSEISHLKSKMDRISRDNQIIKKKINNKSKWCNCPDRKSVV